MKTTLRIASLIFAIYLGAAFGEEQKRPTVTPELRAAFWRAIAEKRATQAADEKAGAKLATVEMEISRACGSTHTPQLDATGEPTCVEKPKAGSDKK